MEVVTYFYADPGEMLELCVYNKAGCRLCLCARAGVRAAGLHEDENMYL